MILGEILGDDVAVEAWASVGFGRDMGWAMRDTSTFEQAPQPPGLTIRRATPDDLDIVFSLDSALVRHESRSPVFMNSDTVQRPSLFSGKASTAQSGSVAAKPSQYFWP